MTLDKTKLLKLDNNKANKQLSMIKVVRFLHLNQKFLLLSSLFLITFILMILLNAKLQSQQSLHQYVKRLFAFKSLSSDENDVDHADKEFDSNWNDETVEIFQEQLGVTFDSEAEVESCHLESHEIIVTALSGPHDDDVYEVLWQFISLIALESQTIQSDNYGREYSIKAFVTEKMRIMLNQLFEG